MELPEIMTICLAQCNEDYCSYALHTQKQTAFQVPPPAKECEKNKKLRKSNNLSYFVHLHNIL